MVKFNGLHGIMKLGKESSLLDVLTTIHDLIYYVSNKKPQVFKSTVLGANNSHILE